MREHGPKNEKPLHWVVRTARTDVDLVAKRLRTAKEDYEERYGKETD